MSCNKWLILTKPVKFALSLSHQVMSDSFAIPWTIATQAPPSMELQKFGGSKITADGDCSHEIKRRLLLRRKAMTNLDSILKSRGITLPTKVPFVKALVFPVVMYGCKSWTIKKTECQSWCFWNVVLEKILQSPLDSKEIKPVNPKGNQSWTFIGRTKAEAPIL